MFSELNCFREFTKKSNPVLVTVWLLMLVACFPGQRAFGNNESSGTVADAPSGGAGVYANGELYELTVTSGRGSGSYAEGEIISISASPPPPPIVKNFYRWVGDVAHVADIYAASTTLTMPAEDISIAASYIEDKTHTYTFGYAFTQFKMEFLDVEHVGNPDDIRDGDPDSPGIQQYGGVNYPYQIGRFEVTIDQFSKAYAADNRIGDGDESYWNEAPRTVGSSGPASNVSAYEAFKFANWLTSGSAYEGAYQFNDEGELVAIDRRAAVEEYGRVYVLTSQDEWYKAAYYKPENDGSYALYANGSDVVADLVHGAPGGWNFTNAASGFAGSDPDFAWSVGSGAVEQSITSDMMGNVWEWTESAVDGSFDDMAEDLVVRGGDAFEGADRMSSTYRGAYGPESESYRGGFRVAAIDESYLELLGISISGADSVNEGERINLECIAHNVDGTAVAVTNDVFWSVIDNGPHVVTESGQFVAGDVVMDEEVEVKVFYTHEDQVYSASLFVTVLVTSYVSPFDAWAEQQNIPEDMRGVDDAPAGDGIPNLLKYACGLQPMEVADSEDLFTYSIERSDPGAGGTASTGLDESSGWFKISFRKSKTAEMVELLPLRADSVDGTWRTDGMIYSQVSETDEYEIWEARVPLEDAGFMRLSARMGDSSGLSFAEWVSAAGVPPSKAGYADSPAGDGVPNLLKYACGIPAMEVASTSDLFTGSFDADKQLFSITYRKSRQAQGVNLIPVWTESLGGAVWSSEGVEQELIGANSAQEIWKASIPMTASGYMRLNAEVETP